jgi:hypothetical protein
MAAFQFNRKGQRAPALARSTGRGMEAVAGASSAISAP